MSKHAQFRLQPAGFNGESGTYTPTLTNGANVAASTASVCQYLRIGNTVTVSGRVDVDPTAAAGTATELGISLPIASAFASATQCAGVAASDVAASMVAQISADAVNDRASMAFLSQSATNDDWYFTFTYLIV